MQRIDKDETPPKFSTSSDYMMPSKLIKPEDVAVYPSTSGLDVTNSANNKPKSKKSSRKQNLSAVALEEGDNASLYRNNLNHDHVSLVSKYRSFLCVICNTRRVGRTHAIPSNEFDMLQWLDVLKPPISIRAEIIERIETGIPQLLCSLHIKDGQPIDYLEPLREKPFDPDGPVHYDAEFAAVADNLNWKARRRHYGGPEQEVVYRVEDLFDQKPLAVKFNEGGRTVMRSSGFKYVCLPAKALLSKRTEDLLRESASNDVRGEDDDLDFQSPTAPSECLSTSELGSVSALKRQQSGPPVPEIPEKLIKKE